MNSTTLQLISKLHDSIISLKLKNQIHFIYLSLIKLPRASLMNPTPPTYLTTNNKQIKLKKLDLNFDHIPIWSMKVDVAIVLNI